MKKNGPGCNCCGDCELVELCFDCCCWDEESQQFNDLPPSIVASISGVTGLYADFFNVDVETNCGESTLITDPDAVGSTNVISMQYRHVSIVPTLPRMPMVRIALSSAKYHASGSPVGEGYKVAAFDRSVTVPHGPIPAWICEDPEDPRADELTVVSFQRCDFAIEQLKRVYCYYSIFGSPIEFDCPPSWTVDTDFSGATITFSTFG